MALYNTSLPIIIMDHLSKETDLSFVTKLIRFGPERVKIRKRKVSFDDNVHVYDTHSRSDINNHNLKQQIWWNINDYQRFNIDANFELINYLKHAETNDIAAAKRHIWRGFIETNVNV